MIVCVCNALCEERCREMAGRAECRSVGCIYREFGCSVRCGKCVPFMRDIFTAAKNAQPLETPARGATLVDAS